MIEDEAYFFALFAIILSVAAQAKLVESKEYVYYDVNPKGYSSLGKAAHAVTPIRREGGKTFLGDTYSNLSWSYHHEQKHDFCRVTSHTVTLKIVMTMPQLVYASEQQKAEFRAYWPKLNRHENNHAQIALDGAKGLDRALANMQRPNCADLKKAIDQKAQYYLDDIKRKSEAYDQRTNHGKTEGASLK